MAKVYLDAGDNFTLSSAASVYGSTGTEKIIISTGVTGVVADANVERVDLAGASSTYTFQQAGNQLKVFSGTTLVATIPVQEDANGTQVVFSNGSVEVKVGATGMTLGGATVPSVAAAAVTPTVVDVTVTTGATTPGTVPVNPSFVLTANADNLAGTSGNDTLTGVISSTATSTTFNATDSIIDTSTTDSDSFTLSVAADVIAGNSGIVRGIETINVNADATILTDTALDFAATNFSQVKAYNFDVTKAASAVNTVNVTGLADNNVKVTASDKFATVSVATTTAGNNLTVDAKAAGSAGAPTSLTVTGAAGDVVVTGAGYLTATSNASTGLLSATAAKNLTLSGTAAKVISATSTGGNVTISDATASVNTTANATGSVSISALDAAGKVTVTAGGTIALSGTATGTAGMDTTSAVLSGVGASTIGTANAITSLSLAGNGAAATYTMAASGSNALTDVSVSGDQNVTLKVDASSIESGSTALNVVDSGAGTFTLEVNTTAGNVDLTSSTNLVDKLVVNVDNTAKTLSVKSGQVVTLKVDQTSPTIAVGTAASAASNTVTIKLDDEVRDANAVDVGTTLTVTQAKTITIDGSVDTTAAGSANLHSIKTLDASAANANVTINMGVNNLDLATAGATTVGTGTITVTGSGTLTDAAGAGTVTSLTAATLDASAMTGAVTLDSTTSLAVGTIKTGSAADTIVLTNNIDQTVNTGAGNDALTLDNASYANKIVVVDMGAGTDTLKFVSGSQLIKGTSGSVSLAGVENIQFANSGTQEVQAALLSGQTYSVLNAATGATNNVGVIVGSTDTTIDLSTLAGSTATETSVAAMTFTTDANLNGAAITIKGLTNAKNIITGSSVGGDSLVGGVKDDTFNYVSSSLLFNSNALLDTISGGTGTDAVNFTATGTAVTVAATDSWANATGVEKITTVDNSQAISLTLGATAQTAGITAVDLSGDATPAVGVVNTINVSAFTSGVTITGAPTTTVDSITGGSGDDTIVYTVAANMFNTNALVDSVVGGAGTDKFLIGHALATGGATFTIAAADSFARVSGVETIQSTTNGAAVVSVTLNADAYAAGVRTVDLSAATATGNTLSATNITGGGMTLTGSATGVTTITGGSGADTITGGSANDSITGGAGNDSISLSAGGTDRVVLNTSSGYDTITGFTPGGIAVTGYDKLGLGALVGTDLVDAAAIATHDVTVVASKITEFNLIFGGTGLDSSTDGSALLAALKVLDANTNVTLTTTASATGFLVAYQNSNAYVYSFDAALTGTNTDIGAADILLVGKLTNINAGALVDVNFNA